MHANRYEVLRNIFFILELNRNNFELRNKTVTETKKKHIVPTPWCQLLFRAASYSLPVATHEGSCLHGSVDCQLPCFGIDRRLRSFGERLQPFLANNSLTAVLLFYVSRRFPVLPREEIISVLLCKYHLYVLLSAEAR